MKIALADIDNNALKDAHNALEAQGAEVMTFSLDITESDAVKEAARETVTRFGSVHMVCANAGVGGFMGPLYEGSDADWDWAIDVNLKGAVNTIQAFLPVLIQNQDESHIVITSSVSGLRVHQPNRGQGMYNTTKFALVGLGEALSLDLQPHGIGVSVLCPGIVKTDITNSARNRQKKYGGAVTRSSEHELASAAAHGTDPVEFGRWVLKGIERDQLYIITHTDDRDQVERRHAGIMQAFDDCERLKQ